MSEDSDPPPEPEALQSVHVFLSDTVGGARFDAEVADLVDQAVRATGGVAQVGGRFPLAKSFALTADPRVIAGLNALDAVKSVMRDDGDLVPPPRSRRVID